MTVGQLQRAINEGDDAIREYARNEVLFTAFENHSISYYGSNDIHYETDTVMPSRLEDNLLCRVVPHMMGYTMRVASQYEDRAPLIASTEMTDVLVLFRSDVHVGNDCVVVSDPSVIIVKHPANNHD